MFLGFQEIRDEDGIWRQVYEELNGRPCASLDRAWGRRHYAELIAATGELLAPPQLLAWGRQIGDKNFKIKIDKFSIDFRRSLTYFWQKTIRQASLSTTEDQLAEALQADLDSLARLRRLRGRAAKQRAVIDWLAAGLPGKPEKTQGEAALGGAPGQEYRLLLPWLLWHRLTPTGAEGCGGKLAQRCLLDEVLCRAMQDGADPVFAVELDQALAETRLLVLLLDQQPVSSAHELFLRMADFLQQIPAREYLGCNLYQGIDWFNRERFVALVHWLCLLGALHLASGEDTDQQLLDAVATLFAGGCDLLALAQTCTYQVEPLIRHLLEATQETRAG